MIVALFRDQFTSQGGSPLLLVLQKKLCYCCFVVRTFSSEGVREFESYSQVHLCFTCVLCAIQDDPNGPFKASEIFKDI